MEEIKEKKRQTSEYFKEKLYKLERELEEIENKILTLKKNKKAVLADIQNCKDEEILFIVKSSKLSIEEIKESLKLAAVMQQSGISSDDVQGFSKEEIVELANESPN